MIPLLLTLLYLGLAAYAGRSIFINKNRSPVAGTVLGIVAALIPPGILPLLVILVITFVLLPSKQIDADLTIDTGQHIDELTRKLNQLATFRDDGVLTEEEFKTTKNRVLASNS